MDRAGDGIYEVIPCHDGRPVGFGPHLARMQDGLDAVEIGFQFSDDQRIVIEAQVWVTARTGVEMEALTAVSVAALTIYDMCKAVDKKMMINEIFLTKKTGGRSGKFERRSVKKYK